MQTPPEKFPFWEVPRTGLKCSNFSDLIVDKYASNPPIRDREWTYLSGYCVSWVTTPVAPVIAAIPIVTWISQKQI